MSQVPEITYNEKYEVYEEYMDKNFDDPKMDYFIEDVLSKYLVDYFMQNEERLGEALEFEHFFQFCDKSEDWREIYAEFEKTAPTFNRMKYKLLVLYPMVQ